MSLWRQVSRGLRVLANRRAADQEVADEVAHYFEQATADWEARGLSPDDARRAARAELGMASAVREQMRDYGWEHVMETIIDDFRYGWRRLRRKPVFVAVAVLTLALGIGASTAIFSVVHPVLLAALPYPDAHRLVMVWDIAQDGSPADVTFGTYAELAQRSRSLEALAVMRPWQPTLRGDPEPERLDGQRVSADYFRVLGVVAALGRGLTDADDQVAAARAVVISHRLWRHRFGEERDVVGRSIVLNEDAYTIVGVMPADFENVLADSDVWIPLQYDRALPPGGREWGHHLRLVARLRPGVDAGQAKQELDTIASSPIGEFPRPAWASLKNGFLVSSLRDDLTRDVKPALVSISGAVLLLLAIACVNVTNLLITRSFDRQGELAMHAALGAPSARIARQLIAEALLVAFLGGGLGIVVAHAGVSALIVLSPQDLPRANAIGVDGAVFAFALGLTTLVGVLVGLIPAQRLSRRALHMSVQRISGRVSGGHQLMRRGLVAVGIALALVLLVGAGLLLRSLQHILSVPPGFDATGVLTMQIQTSGRHLDDDAATHRFFREALDAVRTVPGVTAAAFSSQLPLTGDSDAYGIHLESGSAQGVDGDGAAFRYAVSAAYFSTMRIPLRKGRLLADSDTAKSPLVAVISESLARRRFPGQDALGKRLFIGGKERLYTIVGIVGDVKQASLELSQSDAVYITAEQWQFADRARWLVVRAQADPLALATPIKRAAWSVDDDQPIVRIATMAQRLADSMSQRRFALILFQAFAATALVLAAIGIYGVLSGAVVERRREIGVRLALGASRRSVLALVVRQGMMLTAAGVGIGLIVAFAASRALVSLLFGISELDSVTYVAVIIVMIAVSAIACSIPAWRALRIAPSSVLRSE